MAREGLAEQLRAIGQQKRQWKALKGEAVPKVIKLQREVITAADIDKYVKPDLPDSFWCGSKLPDDVVKQLFTK